MAQVQNNSRRSPIFLLKIYDMLENDLHHEFIKWNNQGTGFIIACSQSFQKNVLPLYFKHSKTHSFIRQLNMYGFSKKKQSGSFYYHPNFQKNKKYLISQIQRKVQNKSKSKKLIQQSNNSQDNSQSNMKCQMININNQLLDEQSLNLNTITQYINPSNYPQLLQTICEYQNIQNYLFNIIRQANYQKNIQNKQQQNISQN